MGVSLVDLWFNGTENDLELALKRYYDNPCVAKNVELEKKMEKIPSNVIENMNGDEFYMFLYYEFMAWKHTDNRWLENSRKKLKSMNNDEGKNLLVDIKHKLFSLYYNDPYDTKTLLECAKRINGIGVSGASGLLSVLFPSKYGTVDQYVVNSLCKVYSFGDDESMKKSMKGINHRKNDLTVVDGTFLINVLREKAEKLNDDFKTEWWTPRKIDMILYNYR